MNVSKRISRGLILNGLKNGNIKVIKGDDGVKAQIGEYGFFIGSGGSDEDFDEELADNIFMQAEEIQSALDHFYDYPDIYKHEYLYYYSYLCEHFK